jgi:hypothetical protein
MMLEGHIENGKVVFDPPADVPEGAKVRVEVLPSAEADGPTLLERLKDIVGKAKHLPPDASYQHDHYLYGTPKKP